MFPFDLINEYGSLVVVSLVVLSFVAGVIDAVVGGGGLIQLPALLINLPNNSLTTLFGTNKIAAISGTSTSAYQYSKKISFTFSLLITIAFCAAIASYAGARTVSYLDINTLKPLILIILILIAVYTFLKKDLGAVQQKDLPLNKKLLYGALLGVTVGFYDGFFGPGTGSFFVLGFVVLLGFEFVEASAYSKVINCITNLSALIVFIRQGSYLLEVAVLMAIFNITGSVIGTRLALQKGNRFVRKIFLLIVSMMIFRYAYDVFIIH